MNVGGIEVGAGYPCRVTAEISGNHMGSKERALALIKHASTAGADFVKFQAFTLPEILAIRGDGPAPVPWDAYTKRQLYEVVQTPLAWFPDLFAHARAMGVVPFSTVMGPDSLAICEAVGCPAYKLASYEADVHWLRESVLETGKPVVVSSGALEPPIPHPQVLALYCPPGYPTGPGNVMFVPGYDGVSYHSTDVDVLLHCVAAGAHMIEVHLMLDAEEYDTQPLDAAFSYTPSQLADLVQRVGRL